MFKPGCRYRHITAKDLDILVMKVRFSDSKRSKLLIQWIDKHTGNVRMFPGNRYDGRSSIEIRAEDYKWWSQAYE